MARSKQVTGEASQPTRGARFSLLAAIILLCPCLCGCQQKVYTDDSNRFIQGDNEAHQIFVSRRSEGPWIELQSEDRQLLSAVLANARCNRSKNEWSNNSAALAYFIRCVASDGSIKQCAISTPPELVVALDPGKPGFAVVGVFHVESSDATQRSLLRIQSILYR